MRLKSSMLLAFAAAALLAAPAAAHAPPLPVSAADDAETTGEQVFVQVKISTGGKTIEHPGHKMETGEELVLVLTEGKKKHEVTVYVEGADGGFKVEVAYTAGGKERLKTEKSVPGKAWTDFKSADGKSVVSLRVNPGKRRAQELEIPDGDNPLDGL